MQMLNQKSLIIAEADLTVLSELVASAVVTKLQSAAQGTSRRLANRDEMAALLGVSLPTLDRLVARANLPSIQIGTRRLFDVDRVFDSLSSKTR